MAVALADRVAENMRRKSNDELLGIWQTNDRSEWSDAAFSAIPQILSERGVAVPPQNSASPRRTAVFAEDFRYQGVGGWLLWLCIALTILGPLSYVADVSVGFNLAGKLAGEPLRPLFLFECVAEILLAALSFYAGLSLWRVTSGAVRKARTFLWAAISYTVVSNLLLFGSGLHVPFEKVAYSSLGSVLGGLIWLIYLGSSKRVRATYGP